MNFANLIFNFSGVTIATSAIAAVGIFVWWLIRIRQKRVWLPTVRILRLESPQLPKIRVTPPPLVPFLCFLLAAATAIFFTLRPKEQVFTPFEPDQTRIHVFLDLSPSISSTVNLAQYSKRAIKLWNSVKSKGRVTMTTTHSMDSFEPVNEQEIEKEILKIGFHRSGIRIGSALKFQIADLGDIDQLLILSDRDQHSWSDFNWKYLLEEMDVLFVDIRDMTKLSESNVFINKARFLSPPSSATMDWDIDLTQKGGDSEKKGVLKVIYEGEALISIPWTIPSGTSKITVRASWPVSKVGMDSNLSQQRLVWRIEAMESDRIEADNEFSTALRGLGQNIVLIGESSGERILEDAAHQLEVSLEIMGFRIRRFDRINQPGPPAEKYPFWVIVGGDGNEVDGFCPQNLTKFRTSALNQTAGLRADAPKVWLVPYGDNANYSDLCWCYDRLLKSNSAVSQRPLFCKDVSDRASYVRVLKSQGANQIGGDIGNDSQAVAWLGKDRASKLEVLAFSLPLRPSVRTGINHAQLPLLINQILKWQNVVDSKSDSENWPRISDRTKFGWDALDSVDITKDKKVELSNVPFGESSLEEISDDLLPPQWLSKVDLSHNQLPMKKDREDPLPWLLLCGFLVFIATAFEALWIGGGAVMRLLDRRKNIAVIFLLISGGLSLSDKSQAEVELSLIGFLDQQSSWASLSKEVTHRTSLSLAKSALFWHQLGDQALEQPWAWVNSIGTVTSKDGLLLPDVSYWLKRGGLLIIQGQYSSEQLRKITSESFRNQATRAEWSAIPPDHVLMRSFYLLDSLPSCHGKVWSGFHFDGRMAILSIPYGFLATISDAKIDSGCGGQMSYEHSARRFINLLMVALATDYKKDQIHLPEILKRLR